MSGHACQSAGKGCVYCGSLLLSRLLRTVVLDMRMIDTNDSNGSSDNCKRYGAPALGVGVRRYFSQTTFGIGRGRLGVAGSGTEKMFLEILEFHY